MRVDNTGSYRAPVEADRGRARGRGPVARLLVAFVLCALLAIGCWVVAPLLGVYMPAVVPLLGFAAIALGTVVSAIQNVGPHGDDGDEDDDAGGDGDGSYRIESY
ncbi:MAG: hypothetical protein R3B68_08245 [Phycisphaerales bacterium]